MIQAIIDAIEVEPYFRDDAVFPYWAVCGIMQLWTLRGIVGWRGSQCAEDVRGYAVRTFLSAPQAHPRDTSRVRSISLRKAAMGLSTTPGRVTK
ncbi:hypothetical protein LCGC14_1877070 [marine sediment metagenome]|uniref:Uncharacterized protein n=1 Tax=marine sediment metagenome TaxID=412755 RepID=A0A0F9GRD1_9ZZZZ